MSKPRSTIKPIGYRNWIRWTMELYNKQEQASKTISKNLRYYRKKAGLTQRELADLTGKKQPDVARQERTSYKSYTIKNLVKYAHVLKIDLADLVTPRGKDD